MGNLDIAGRGVSTGVSPYLRYLLNAAAEQVFSHRLVLTLFAAALFTRVPLMSISLDEVDSANFYNALRYGYDITQIRPHPPGYPIYVFMAWLVNSVLNDPLLSLTLLSALLGSLAIIPFYLLLRDLTGPRIAFVGSLLFLANPLIWSVSESALSDAPSMFFALLGAWLSFRAMRSDRAFIWACIVLSLAIGVRQPNMALLVLPAFALGYRHFVRKDLTWKLPVVGVVLFTVLTAAWFFPSVYTGAGSLAAYIEWNYIQYQAAVHAFDITRVESPWLMNVLLRVSRFLFGYFLTYAWTGGDSRTPLTMLLSFPWIFGFGLFMTSFRPRDPRHLFLALWMASLLYTILVIHFLPRYGLPQLPAFVMAAILGYQFLGQRLLRRSNRSELLSLVGIGSVLVLFGIKYQAPVSAFEFTPPAGTLTGSLFLAAGVVFLVLPNWLYRRSRPYVGAERQEGPPRAVGQPTGAAVTLAMLGLLLAPFAFYGYGVASIAHREVSPSQRLVEYVRANFDGGQVVPCLDWQSHSFFDALIPEARPRGLRSAEELLSAHRRGKVVLASDHCIRFEQIHGALGLRQVAEFSGSSPLWAKTPSMRLYVPADYYPQLVEAPGRPR